VTWVLDYFWKKRIDTFGRSAEQTDHDDFDGNMSRVEAVKLDDQFGSSL